MAHSKKSVSMVEFCKQYGIKQQAFKEILMLRSQLCGIMKLPEVVPARLPNPEELVTMRKIIAQCFVDNVARLVRKEEMGKYAKCGLRHAYMAAACKEPVIIANVSFLYGQMPDYVVYHEIVEFNFKSMRGVTRVNYKWLEDASPDFIKTFERREFPA